MTHVNNLETYFRDGCIRANNQTPIQKGFQTSYRNIVARRGTDFFAPCGSSVNDFVPFYFSPATSMAYVISKGSVGLVGPDGEDLGIANMDDLAFVVCDVEKVAKNIPNFWFTNIACNSGITPSYENDIGKLEQHVAWHLFDDAYRMGHIPEIGYDGACKFCTDSDFNALWANRTKQCMAEFLIKENFPMDLAECVVIKQSSRKSDVESWISNAGLPTPVLVKSGCYF
jgi:hypothetical protein